MLPPSSTAWLGGTAYTSNLQVLTAEQGALKQTKLFSRNQRYPLPAATLFWVTLYTHHTLPARFCLALEQRRCYLRDENRLFSALQVKGAAAEPLTLSRPPAHCPPHRSPLLRRVDHIADVHELPPVLRLQRSKRRSV